MDKVIKNLVNLLEEKSDEFSHTRDFTNPHVRSDDQELKEKSRQLRSVVYKLRDINQNPEKSLEDFRIQVNEIIREECYSFSARRIAERLLEEAFKEK